MNPNQLGTYFRGGGAGGEGKTYMKLEVRALIDHFGDFLFQTVTPHRTSPRDGCRGITHADATVPPLAGSALAGDAMCIM